MKFSEEEVSMICRVLSSILLIGNIIFISNSDRSFNESAAIKNHNCTEIISKLLAVNREALEDCIISRNISTKNNRSITKVNLSITQSQDSRDAFSKHFYFLLFQYPFITFFLYFLNYLRF
jgi:myosin heavy subunit